MQSISGNAYPMNGCCSLNADALCERGHYRLAVLVMFEHCVNRSGGFMGAHPACPPKGTNSFVSTYKFYEMYARWVLVPPMRLVPLLREILDPPLIWLEIF